MTEWTVFRRTASVTSRTAAKRLKETPRCSVCSMADTGRDPLRLVRARLLLRPPEAPTDEVDHRPQPVRKERDDADEREPQAKLPARPQPGQVLVDGKQRGGADDRAEQRTRSTQDGHDEDRLGGRW